MSVDIVVLAAGQGSRMKSSLPKVLHPIGGKPMVQHVLDRAACINDASTHVVIGHGAEQLKAALEDQSLTLAVQAEQLGTGHAVAQAMPGVKGDVVLVLYGDVPLTRSETMQQLVEIATRGNLGLLTVELEDPTGYGRIIRDEQGAVTAIVEQKDANEAQLEVRETNTGILAAPAEKLTQWLPALSSENAQGEYYLTDIIAMAAGEGLAIEAIQPGCEEEVQGVNNRLQQAQLERWYQQQLAQRLMADGVTLMDPARIDIRGNLSCGYDVVIDVNCIFEGDVVLGDGVVIEPGCVIRNASIAAGTRIKANSNIEQAEIAEFCDIGPFARLRPGTVLAPRAKVGNFVETKKTQIGEGSKVNHLSYVGDAEIGAGANIGAGTITCNYDGVNKYRTQIGNGAFIGSNTSLVAPVSIGEGATVAAGSTVTKAVSDNELAVARGKQRNISGWQKPVKN